MADTTKHPNVDDEQGKAKSLADEALERSDALGLHRLFLREQEKYRELLGGFDALVSIYAGNSEDRKRLDGAQEESSTVCAMRDVALQAIELAKLHLCKPRTA